MNFASLFKSQHLHVHWAVPLANAFLCVWFLYAYCRHRTQFAFLIWSFGGFSATVVSTFLLGSHLRQEIGTEFFSGAVWRTLAFLDFILEPMQFVCGIMGALVLVWTYPKASRKRA